MIFIIIYCILGDDKCSIITKNGRDDPDNVECNLKLGNYLFISKAKLVYVIPGFVHNEKKSVVNQLNKDIITSYPGSVVGIVIWEKAARFFKSRDEAGWIYKTYEKAAVSSWPIGNIVAYVNDMIYPRHNKVYCVGHSLGAQICGFMAKMAKSMSSNFVFAKIIAMDPAGPVFNDEQHSSDLRLNERDAPIVEVWHTNTNSLGFKKPMGTVDFYINGGARQPWGCSAAKERGIGICSHIYSNKLLMYLKSKQLNCVSKWQCARLHTTTLVHPNNLAHEMLAPIEQEMPKDLFKIGCREIKVENERPQLGMLDENDIALHSPNTRRIYWVEVSPTSKTCEFTMRKTSNFYVTHSDIEEDEEEEEDQQEEA